MAESPPVNVAREVISVPSSVLKRNQGCAVDIGGSSIKIAYAVQDGECTAIHFACYSRKHLDEALEFLRQRLSKMDQYPDVINATGITCCMFESQIQNTIQAKMKIQSEFQMFVDSFMFLLKQFSINEVTHPISEEVIEYGRVHEAGLKAFRKQIDGNDDTAIEENEELQDENLAGGDAKAISGIQFPCLMFTCGSSLVPFKIEADGGMQWLVPSMTGGKFLLGQASLLLGTDNFSEIISLAERGTPSVVDTYSNDLETEDPDSIYRLPPDVKCYAFGKAQGKSIGDFNKEDLAASLVHNVGENTAEIAHQWALLIGAKQVFFVGSLGDQSEYMRNVMGKSFTLRNLQKTLGKEVDNYYFLKNGGYLGAFGALLKTLNED